MKEAPLIDQAALDALAAGLPVGSLEGVLLIFANDLARRRAALDEALSVRNLEALRLLAHGIAGSASTFCAGSLAQAATQLELVAATGHWEPASAAAARLAAEADRVVAELHRRGGHHSGSQP